MALPVAGINIIIEILLFLFAVFLVLLQVEICS